MQGNDLDACVCCTGSDHKFGGCLCRLCNPYITTTILEDTFGELASEVAAKYLTEYEKGRFCIKKEYARWASSCLGLLQHTQ